MIAANITALGVESAKTTGEGSRSREAWHHRYWLLYGRLQQGRLADAKEMLLWARERISNEPLPREPAYYGAMYARYLIDTELWTEAEDWLAPEGVDIPTPHYAFARAYAAAKLGNIEKARLHLAEISVGGEEANPEIILTAEEVSILKSEVEGVIEMSEGNFQRAIAIARQAAEMQARLPFRYGPPRISKPTSELLADFLLEREYYEEASNAFTDQLSRSQLRTNSLLGLLRASSKTGDESAVKESSDSLSKVWHGADREFPLFVDFSEL
jgi:tetratricopeptide (TPR) repeat protein